MENINAVDVATDYLQENGYTLMHSNNDGSWGNFVSLDGSTSIEVTVKNNEVRLIGCGFIPQSMIQIKSPDFGIGNKALWFNLKKIELALTLYHNYID